MTLRWSILFHRKLSGIYRKQLWAGPKPAQITVSSCGDPYGSHRKLLKITVSFYRKPYRSYRKVYGINVGFPVKIKLPEKESLYWVLTNKIRKLLSHS